MILSLGMIINLIVVTVTLAVPCVIIRRHLSARRAVSVRHPVRRGQTVAARAGAGAVALVLPRIPADPIGPVSLSLREKTVSRALLSSALTPSIAHLDVRLTLRSGSLPRP
jgi:hypothetical protein